jgi:hypothetical protein
MQMCVPEGPDDGSQAPYLRDGSCLPFTRHFMPGLRRVQSSRYARPFLLRRPELRRTGRDKRRQRGFRESGARTKRSIEGDDEDENGWEDDDDWETVNLKTFHLADM